MPDAAAIPPDAPGAGVRIFRAFPESFADLGISSMLQHTRTGPCLLIYDRKVFDAWDAPFWNADGTFRPARPEEDAPCRLCGQPMSCRSQGPGEIALWSGPAAARLVEGLRAADEEWLLAAQWDAFCAHADVFDAQEHRGLAEHVASERFRGFRALDRGGFSPHMGWRHSRAAESLELPGWTAATGLTRLRHLPPLLALLESLGVRTPADVPTAAQEPPAALARRGATALLGRLEEDRVRLEAEIRSRARWSPPPPRWPEPAPPTAEEELAEALMGYDHAAGEPRPWGPFRGDMRGHNGGPPAEG